MGNEPGFQAGINELLGVVEAEGMASMGIGVGDVCRGSLDRGLVGAAEVVFLAPTFREGAEINLET